MNDETTIDGCKVEWILKHVTEEEALAELDYAIRKGLLPESEWEKGASEYWTYGWKTDIGKNQYGDWLRLTDASDPTLAEAREHLTEQARQTIDQVKKTE